MSANSSHHIGSNSQYGCDLRLDSQGRPSWRYADISRFPRPSGHMPPAGICISLLRIAGHFYLRGATFPVTGCSQDCAPQIAGHRYVGR